MADALTAAQLEIMRRVRDGTELTAPPFIPHLVNELSLLHRFQLLRYRNPLELELTWCGSEYLARASDGGSRWPDFAHELPLDVAQHIRSPEAEY